MIDNYDDDKTVDIPDFVEDKSDTTSTSVDMSIFKMSDDELYDDADESEEDEDDDVKEIKPRRKAKTSLILIIMLLLVSVGLVVSLLFVFKYKNSVDEYTAQVAQLNTKINELNKTISDNQTQITTLQTELEAAKKKATEKVVYKIVDGPIYFRQEPSTSGAETTYGDDDAYCAYNNEEYKVIEVVEDGSYKWAKVADEVYFCITNGTEVFAEVVE